VIRNLLFHVLSLTALFVSVVNLCLAMKLIIVVDEEYSGMAGLAPGLIVVSLLMWAAGCWLSRFSRPRKEPALGV